MVMLRIILLSALTLMVSATEAQDKSGADKAPRTIGASGKHRRTRTIAPRVMGLMLEATALQRSCLIHPHLT